MIDLTRHPHLLRLLALGSRGNQILRLAGTAATRSKSNRSGFYRAAWSDAAAKLNLTVRELADEIFELTNSQRRTVVFRNYTQLDDPVVLRIAGNKRLVHQLLADRRLPVPPHETFSLSTIRLAVEFWEQQQPGMCVVKPTKNTGGGRGVTTGIQSRRQLARAAIAAAAFGHDLLIERQMEGDNYRLLFLDGQLIDAIRRPPPSVIGDGRSTIARLIRLENARRLERSEQYGEAQLTADVDLRQTLTARKLSLRSIPPAGETIALKTVINQNATCDNESVGDRLSTSIVDACREATIAVGARLAGVDIVTTDIRRPLNQVGGVILEVNTTPGFHFHYQKRDGTFPVAEYVLQKLMFSDDQTLSDDIDQLQPMAVSTILPHE